ncbi:hypothetical protein DL96DRAFT_1706664 [Flagelloscypha sp. PMI_526]|nr:hypothetical protein DL96DRAFT_1706664 [Flagelloscypha sp. PMI_526]
MTTSRAPRRKRVFPPNIEDEIFTYAAYIYAPCCRRNYLRLVAKHFDALVKPILDTIYIRFEHMRHVEALLGCPNATQKALYVDGANMFTSDCNPKLLEKVIPLSLNVRRMALCSMPDAVDKLASLPYLEVFSIRYTYEFGIGIDVSLKKGLAQPIFQSLTHLYCEFISPWGDEVTSASVPAEAFPVLSHAAFNMLNLDSLEAANVQDAFEGIQKWLQLPSLQKLILRFDALPDDYPWRRQDFLDEYRNYLLSLGDDGEKQMFDPRVVIVRMNFDEPEKEENHFDFLDRLWTLSRETYERL